MPAPLPFAYALGQQKGVGGKLQQGFQLRCGKVIDMVAGFPKCETTGVINCCQSYEFVEPMDRGCVYKRLERCIALTLLGDTSFPLRLVGAPMDASVPNYGTFEGGERAEGGDFRRSHPTTTYYHSGRGVPFIAPDP